MILEDGNAGIPGAHLARVGELSVGAVEDLLQHLVPSHAKCHGAMEVFFALGGKEEVGWRRAMERGGYQCKEGECERMHCICVKTGVFWRKLTAQSIDQTSTAFL